MTKTSKALGFMSGTSMDGIDIALIETDGENRLTRFGGMSKPYGNKTRKCILEAVTLVKNATQDEWPYLSTANIPDCIVSLDAELVRAHASLADEFLEVHTVAKSEIDLIGYHGQTLTHRPEIGFTLQLGNGAMLARKTGLRVVNALRQNDVAQGGEGAPLAPIYHQCLVKKFILENRLPKGPYVFVNIGGVSNVSFIEETGNILAFDTGPGNALLDDWVAAHTSAKCDTNGKFALAGTANENWCENVLRHSYFEKSPPKSIDRNLFVDTLASLKDKNINLEDGAASLVLLTARSIARATKFFLDEPKSWIIGGGGRHNPAIISALQKEVSGELIVSDELGIDGDLIEAECFAYLAVRCVNNLPITFPGTTGVPTPLTGGIIHEP